jgi:hypothetical protein
MAYGSIILPTGNEDSLVEAYLPGKEGQEAGNATSLPHSSEKIGQETALLGEGLEDSLAAFPSSSRQRKSLLALGGGAVLLLFMACAVYSGSEGTTTGIVSTLEKENALDFGYYPGHSFPLTAPQPAQLAPGIGLDAGEVPRGCEDVYEKYAKIYKDLSPEDIGDTSQNVSTNEIRKAMAIDHFMDDNLVTYSKAVTETFVELLDLGNDYLYGKPGMEKFCARLFDLPFAPEARCAAAIGDGTVTISFEASATFGLTTESLGINTAWGEDGQKSCSYTKGGKLGWYFKDLGEGFDMGILGGEVGWAIDFMPRRLGGFGNIGSNRHDGGEVRTVSVSMGSGFNIAAYVIFDAIKIDPQKVIDAFEKAKKKFEKRVDVTQAKKNIGPDSSKLKQFGLSAMTYFFDLVIAVINGSGLCGFGIALSLGGDVADYLQIAWGDVEASSERSSEFLITCEGESCPGKVTFGFDKKHGDECLLPFNCIKCEETAYPWYGDEDHVNPLVLRCGVQKCWNAGTACGTHPWNPCYPQYTTVFSNQVLHSPGQTCCGLASFWYGWQFGSRCGFQECWEDGTNCGTPQSPCEKACCAGFGTFWQGSETGYKCGEQPCWGKGTQCGSLPINSPCSSVCCKYSWGWTNFSCD